MHMCVCVCVYCESFEAFTAVMSQVKVFWVVMTCSVMIGYQSFRGPCCLHLQGGDEDSMDPLQHYTASQTRGSRLGTSSDT